jgi:hypothetical protein
MSFQGLAKRPCEIATVGLSVLTSHNPQRLKEQFLLRIGKQTLACSSPLSSSASRGRISWSWAYPGFRELRVERGMDEEVEARGDPIGMVETGSGGSRLRCCCKTKVG